MMRRGGIGSGWGHTDRTLEKWGVNGRGSDTTVGAGKDPETCCLWSSRGGEDSLGMRLEKQTEEREEALVFGCSCGQATLTPEWGPVFGDV